MNPLDRNHDGKVNLQDLKPGQPGYGQQGLAGQQGLGMGQQGLAGAHHNPLDRNFDGKVDINDLAGRPAQGQVQGQYIQSQQRSSIGQIHAQPTVLETIQKDVVVHEHIHPVQKEEIQPIIYREREQLDVKQVTQMMHETQIQPTLIQQRELPAERREAIIERGAAIQENYVAPSREVDAVSRTQVVHAPIVNEVIKKTVIEEIQPVLERDIIQSTVIQNTKPIYEKVVEAPHVYRETTTVIDRGIVGGDIAALEAQGFNLGQAGRRLSQGYSQTTVTQSMGMQQGLGHNPLDRNHDGRVDARDFAGQPGYGQQGLAGAHHNPLDRNHDGRVDARDFAGQPGYGQQGLGMGQQQGLVAEQRQFPVASGIGSGSGITQQQQYDARPIDNPTNPLTQGLHNHQGLAGQQGLGQQGLAGAHHNPLDRNHDGKVNLQDLKSQPAARPNTINTL